MNRTQRRLIAKKGITADELKRLYENTKMESVRQTVDVYSVVVAMYLRDKQGFGEKRLKRAMAEIEEIFDSVKKGYVDVDDMKNTILEECNIKIGG